MTHLAIVGATGMVGGYCLRYALGDPKVDRVTAIGRRSLGVSHPKLQEVSHQDFGDCSALAGVLSSPDAVMFCLGVYTGAVSDAELRKTTVDYPIEFARALRVSNAKAIFALLSGAGADQTGRSRFAFARYKGEAEAALIKLGPAYVFRPAYIYPVEARKEPTVSYRVMRALYPVFRIVTPHHVIRADDLARVMVNVTVHGDPESRGPIFEHRDIQAMA